MKPIRLLAAALIWAATLPAAAAMSATGALDQAMPLSLETALQTACEQNPKMIAAAAQVEAAAQRSVQVKSGLFPQISFVEDFQNTTNPMWAFGTRLNQQNINANDFDPLRLNDPAAINNFASNFRLDWPLYDSGQTTIGRQQAQLGEQAAALLLDRVRQEVMAETAEAYAGLQLNQENLAVVEQTMETARANLKMVQDRYETGLFVKSDLLRAQVRIAQLEQQLSQAKSRVEIARSALNAAMGVDIERRFSITTPLKPPIVLQKTLDEWVSIALARRPDFQQVRYQEQIVAKEVQKAKAGHYPSLRMVGNYQINTESWSDFADNYTVGAVMNINLFSGNRMTARQREARAALVAAKARVREAEQGIRVQAHRAYFETQSARQCVGVTQSAISQAEENLRIVGNRYQNGLVTIVNLLDAEVALQQARSDYFGKLHDYQVAAARLALAVGTIGENAP